MTSFDPELAEIRFGCGLSPVLAPPAAASAMLAGLTGPDAMVDAFPIETYPVFRERMIAAQTLWKERRKHRGSEKGERLRKEINLLKKAARQDHVKWLGQTMMRRIHTETGFRERLVWFWYDHFIAHGKAGVSRRAASPYIESAIRPHITGRFEDLLISAATHPVMQQWLDQHNSMGPNSDRNSRAGGKFGLNENLAREILELFTLGVDGPYTQKDVRELAELLTGLSFQPQAGLKFRKDYVEPGGETVLGVAYPDAYSMTPIRQVLRDLAAHPATARHLARKIAVHFVSDQPEPGLIDALESAYLATTGDLMAVYDALLSHPASWDPVLSNVKTPVDFVSSALRALRPDPSAFRGLDENRMRRFFVRPMALMGLVWQKPSGPDGWPEEDGAWLTPQGLSARITWALQAPQEIMGELPDPRALASAALGARLSGPVRFAAEAAETKSEAIGIVLSSPAFQRR